MLVVLKKNNFITPLNIIICWKAENLTNSIKISCVIRSLNNQFSCHLIIFQNFSRERRQSNYETSNIKHKIKLFFKVNKNNIVLGFFVIVKWKKYKKKNWSTQKNMTQAKENHKRKISLILNQWMDYGTRFSFYNSIF